MDNLQSEIEEAAELAGTLNEQINEKLGQAFADLCKGKLFGEVIATTAAFLGQQIANNATAKDELLFEFMIVSVIIQRHMNAIWDYSEEGRKNGIQ